MPKYLFSFFLIFISTCINSQKKQIQKVNDLIKLSEELAYKDGLKSLEHAKKALDISKAIKNNKLIIKSSIVYAEQLSILNYYKESLEVVSDLENRIVIRDDLIKYEIKTTLKYHNYKALGLQDLALNELKEAELIVQKLDSKNSKIYSADLNTLLASYFWKIGDYKLANQHVDKALKTSENISLDFLFSVYIEKAYACIGLKKKDSSEIYIQKAFIEHSKSHNQASKYLIYETQGYHYLQFGSYKKAIESYHLALEEMKNYKVYDLTSSVNIKQRLAKAYGMLGDIENQNKYNKEAESDLSNLKDKTNKALVQAVHDILNDRKKESNNIRTQNRCIIITISGISLALLSFLYFRNRKIKKRKRRIIKQNENLIVEYSELEKQKEVLSKKAEVNQLGELINLAKNNSTEFVVLFEELYPIFIKNIKAINPKINNSELHFCGLAFLNFSTKEIAEMTFVTVAAIQLRKHRIRKKYEIPSNKDFNLWMKELNI